MYKLDRVIPVCVRRFAVVALVGFWFGTYPSLVWSQCDGLSTEQILGWGGATGDEIGVSVSVSGGVAVIGAHRDDDNGPDSGSAYIYRLGGGSWNPEQKLIPLDGASGDRFGSSVATSGDVVIVGAFLHYDNGTDSGSAYVFRFNGSNWIEEQELLPADGAAGDGFGASVAVSGNVAVIGAGWNDDNGMSSGSAYVFRFNGVNWIQEQKLLAADGASGDLFGHSVAVSGNVAIVGSRFDDDNGTDSGSSYVYRFNGASWTQEQKLLPLGGESEDYFGHSVGISDDVVVIGAYRDGDSDIGYFDTGAAYVFRFNGSSWIEESKLTASDRFSGDHFGKTVAVNGDQIVIGAPNSDKNCQWYFRPECGMAYLFEFTGSSWVEQTRLMEPETGTGTDHFGSSVAIASGVILVGSLSDSNDTNGTYGGAAYALTGQCAPAGCTVNTDCDDEDPCTTDSCESGSCVYTNNTASCDDGDNCTTGDRCSNGACSGTPLSCDDANLCTNDSCSNGSCQHTNNTVSCNDSDACTTGDRCSNGSCTGTPRNCDDGNLCTNDFCSNGNCQYTNNTVFCNDGNACTTGDQCSNGSCHGALRNCDDDNICTNDFCSNGICQFTNNAASCNDGDACTIDDTCTSGTCSGTDLSCDDSVSCTNDFCAKGVCFHDATGCDCQEDLDCDDDNVCTNDWCSNGSCQYASSNRSCSDGNSCTTGDRCSNGICDGSAIECDDSIDCTNDYCENGVCRNDPADCDCLNDGDCDDDHPCTKDTCDADGSCVNGLMTNCCGNGSCDTAEDVCSCSVDCGAPTSSEFNCFDGLDDDCDGWIDETDSDCVNSCSAFGAACTTNIDCCSRKCKGEEGSKTCKKVRRLHGR